MITAQDIREQSFPTAKFGGYDMPAVDDFLDSLADELTAAQKENSVLKSKMKVLVDKIEEYRANEEALSMAVLNAQKLALQIESDARTRAAAMIAEAQEKVDVAVGTIREQTEDQERRLAEAQAATAKFCEGVVAMCNIQLNKIAAIQGTLPQEEPEEAPAPAPVADPAPSVEGTVESIAASIATAEPDDSFNFDFSGDIAGASASDADPTRKFKF